MDPLPALFVSARERMRVYVSESPSLHDSYLSHSHVPHPHPHPYPPHHAHAHAHTLSHTHTPSHPTPRAYSPQYPTSIPTSPSLALPSLSYSTLTPTSVLIRHPYPYSHRNSPTPPLPAFSQASLCFVQPAGDCYDFYVDTAVTCHLAPSPSPSSVVKRILAHRMQNPRHSLFAPGIMGRRSFMDCNGYGRHCRGFGRHARARACVCVRACACACACVGPDMSRHRCGR